MPEKNSQINELLTRGIENVFPSRSALKKALKSKKRLTVYLGIDPTTPQLHLGHSITLLLLKRFQKLGHKTILLVGDFTARVGDPSGKTVQRKPLSANEVLKNAESYKEQAGKILEFSPAKNPATLMFNSKWLGKINFEKILEIASFFTVQQMLARHMFRKRMAEGSPISLNEFLYPLMQGYDSVGIKTDVEVGGNDQLFNMLVGRDLVKRYLKKEKFVITTKLLVDPDTGAKMSKSEGHLIGLTDPPNDMYAKIMAFPDELIHDCFELCTEVPLKEIEGFKKVSARDAKARLAREIVTMYHSKDAAEAAEKEFSKVFSFRRPPTDITIGVVMKGETNTARVLVEIGLSSSMGEARRLIEQGGAHVQMPNKKEWRTAGESIEPQDGMIIRVGKRRFKKLKIKN